MVNRTILISPSKYFAILAVSFLIGVFISTFCEFNFYYTYSTFLLFVSLALLVAFINFILKNSLLAALAWCFVFLLLGVAYFSSRQSVSNVEWPEDTSFQITGTIVSKPEIEVNKQKVIVKTEEVLRSGATINSKGLLLVSVSRLKTLEYGYQIKLVGKIKRPGMINDFNYGNYLKKYPIYGLVSDCEDVEILSVSANLKSRVYRSLYRLTDKLVKVFNQSLPEPHASLASGIILGQKSDIPEELTNSLSRTGLSHIVSLSGYNVTIIVTALSSCLIALLGRRKVFIIGSALVMVFIIATGMSPSVVRAAIFSLLLIFGKTIGRHANKLNLMLLGAMVLVLYNPFMLRYDLGFQLSFLAFIGLCYLSADISKWFEVKKLPIAGTLFADTLGAQIMTLPLLLSTFGQLSLIAPIANAVTIWILPYIMAAGFATAFVGACWGLLGKISSYLLWPALEYVIRSSTILSNLSFAAVIVDKSWMVSLTGYSLIVIYFLLKKLKRQLITAR